MRSAPTTVLASLLVLAVAAVGPLPGAAADTGDAALVAARQHLDAAEDALFDAGTALLADDTSVALVALTAALDAADGARSAASSHPSLSVTRRRVAPFRRRIERARTAVDAAARDARPAVLALRAAVASGRAAIRGLRGRGTEFELREAGGGRVAVRPPAGRAVFRIVPTRCAADATLVARNDDPGATALAPVVERLGRGRFRVTWGPDLGAGRVEATACGVSRGSRCLNLGPAGALTVVPPSGFSYAATVAARVGSELAATGPAVAGDRPLSFTVEPALPAGLVLDAVTGAVSGTPLAPGPLSHHLVTARNVRGAASADLEIDVDPALPAGVTALAAGFAIQAVVVGAEFPAKIAPAADGRLFFDELLTGNVRVVAADGTLDAAPVVTVPVLTGGERGLLGLALAPDFAASGTLFVYASTAAGDGHAARNRVLRYTLGTGGAGGASGPELIPDVIADDLPIGDTQNAGALAFGPDGNLYVTVGDTGDSSLAQTDGSLAGRVLRFAPDGGVPSDNPVAGSPEWARGFRNPFGLAFQTGTGYLFATENGPTAHDELDLVQPGKNFEWGAEPDQSFGALRGIRITDWTPVIVPTGIAFHPGPGFGDAFAGNLFLASYDQAEVRRVVLSGIDLESEAEFVQFDDQGIDQKPLDVAVGPDGSLWISTFTTIWRVRRD